MKNEERIKNSIKLLSENALKNGLQGITAQELEIELGLKRNVISHHLNRMVEEDIVVKTKTRPVYFLYKAVAEKQQKIETQKVYTDIFSNMIGSTGSLASAIEQCKAATLYPGKGLPMLITGSSGVGKSFMAKIIHEYAIQKGVIKEGAKFVTFNCADYANNKELLSSKLFGHVKGAFTGADKDSLGVIEEAEGGYLFLDEIHRLSPEGQEKLFLLLDKGQYRRVGENGGWRTANIRLVCATTEMIKEVLIDTFIRRIPIVVNLPNINDRPIYERVELIYNFYNEESRIIKKDIIINEDVINYLLSVDFIGNVGGLRNALKYSCASALRKSINSEITINIENFPEKILDECVNIKKYFNFGYLHVNHENQIKDIRLNTIEDDMFNIYKNIINEIREITESYDNREITSEEYKKNIGIKFNRGTEKLYFDNNYNKDSLEYRILLSFVERGLKIVEENYGIKFYGNMSQVLTASLQFFRNNKNIEDEELEEKEAYILKVIKERKYKYNFMAQRLLKVIENYSQNKLGLREELYMTLFIYNIVRKSTNNDINGVIVAHGYSTASSIASVVNQLLEDYVFEPFDMPIDIAPKEVVESIKAYTNNMDTNKGAIFLVDMGSLFEIYPMIKDIFNGEIAIVNNITTQLALFVGDMILKGSSIIEIIDKVVKESKISYKFFEGKERKKAIVTTCASGIGTAQKIKEIIKSCIQGEDIEVVTCDYFELKNYGISNEIFRDYDVELIVSTLELNVEGIESIVLSDFFREESEEKLRRILGKIIKHKSKDNIINDLVKMLSLQNIISKIIILNPQKVIDDVDRVLNIIEAALNYRIESDLRLTLFIHMAVMIERLVLDRDGGYDSVVESKEKYDTIESKLLHKIINEELKDYSITIHADEIELIMGIIESKKII